MNNKHSKIKMKYVIFLFVGILFFISGCMGSKRYIKNGAHYIEHKEWDKSVQYLRPLVEKHPGNVELKMMLFRSEREASISHMAKGEKLLETSAFDEAILELKKAVSYNSVNYKANILLKKAEKYKISNDYYIEGVHRMDAGEYLEARKYFEKSLEYNSENKDSRQQLAYFLSEKKKAKGGSPKYKLKLRSNAPISLKFKKTPIVNVFEILSKLSGINFIFDKDMKETKVTLFMTDVSFDRFIDVLLKTNDLAARQINEKTLLVYPETPSKVKEYTDLQIKTFYLSNISSKKMVHLLTKILKIKDISENEKLNSIVIRGTDDVIELASKIIVANDCEPAEVILNVEILEVNRNKEQQLGIEFSDSVTMGIGESSTSIGAAPTDTESSQFTPFASLYSLEGLSNKEVMVSLPTATLNLLKRDGDTKTLAKPQIRVKNMEKASIHVGDRVPIRSNRKVDSNNNETYDYEYQDVGIKLSVLPVINMENDISLTLTLEVSGLGTRFGTAQDPVYTIRTRMAKTVLTMRDGEMIVIGGLINDEDIGSIQKLPILGDIPILGALFSKYGTEVTQKDVLMIITPAIIKSQVAPEGDMLEIWSGKEKQFSLRPPYEDLDRELNKYQDYPGEEYFEDKKNEQKRDKELPPTEDEPKSSSLNMEKDDEINESVEDSFHMAENIPDNKENPGSVNLSKEEVVSKAAPSKNDFFEKNTATVWPDKLPYSIHVNSYTDKKNAEKRISKLMEMDYESFLVSANIPGRGLFYRVFVGRFNDIEDAKQRLSVYRNKKEFRKDIHIMDRKHAFGG